MWKEFEWKVKIFQPYTQILCFKNRYTLFLSKLAAVSYLVKCDLLDSVSLHIEILLLFIEYISGCCLFLFTYCVSSCNLKNKKDTERCLNL